MGTDLHNLTLVQGTLFLTLYGRALDSRASHPIWGDTMADELTGNRDLVHSDAPFAALHVAPASLEEAFLALTSLPTHPSGDRDSHHHRPQFVGTEVPR